MSYLSHPLIVERVDRLNFLDCRPTELHAVGCAHKGKALYVDTDIVPPSEADGYDDFYEVAPCARQRGAKRLPVPQW